MMNNYFTISEFARLRNININSLRYYEKIGVLIPAYINENSGYRYYAPDQLPMLDIILMCIDSGIPLKQLVKYGNESGGLQNKELLETGRSLVREQIRECRRGLDKLEHTLDYLASNRQYANQKGVYTREIIERRIIAMSYEGDLEDQKTIEKTAAQLLDSIQKMRLTPIFSAGLLIHAAQAAMDARIFYEILERDSENPSVQIIPKGKFLCRQTDLTSDSSLIDVVHAMLPYDDKTQLIISNMILDTSPVAGKKIEVQQPV